MANKKKSRARIGCACGCGGGHSHSKDKIGMIPMNLKAVKKGLKNKKITINAETGLGVATGVLSEPFVTTTLDRAAAKYVEDPRVRLGGIGVLEGGAGAWMVSSKSDFLTGLGLGWVAMGARNILEATGAPDLLADGLGLDTTPQSGIFFPETRVNQSRGSGKVL